MIRRLCLAIVLSTCAMAGLLAQTAEPIWPPVLVYGADRLHKPQLGRDSLRVMSLSLLPSVPERDEYIERWVCRKDQVIHLMRDCHVDILGLQRPLPSQVALLTRSTGYAYAGETNADTITAAGARFAILYNPSRFNLIASGTTAGDSVAANPMTGVKNTTEGYGWATLEDKAGKRRLLVFSCLLRSAHMARTMIADIKSRANGIPVIIAADLMAETFEPVPRILRTAGLADSFAVTAYRSGAIGTFHDFRHNNPIRRMDYVFLSPTLQVPHYEVVDEAFSTSRPSSDHLPVMVDISLGKAKK